MSKINYVNIHDNTKAFREGAEIDYRTGNANIGSLLGFTPYEKGYCFLTVLTTPKFMRAGNAKTITYEDDNRAKLLSTFTNILELEFTGLSGLEDQTLETNDISNNIINTTLVTKSSRTINNTIDMTFTEKSGTPITKFMDMYTRYLFDPYTGAKTYGGRLRTDNEYITGGYTSHNRNWGNETFNLLYTITDNTGYLVEKAFILYHATPLNTSFSTLYNMDKFDVAKAEISLQWSCTVVDGNFANKLGTMYVRSLMESMRKQGLLDDSYNPVASIASTHLTKYNKLNGGMKRAIAYSKANSDYELENLTATANKN